jgi:uncharacterized protein (DUF1697 family)
VITRKGSARVGGLLLSLVIPSKTGIWLVAEICEKTQIAHFARDDKDRGSFGITKRSRWQTQASVQDAKDGEQPTSYNLSVILPGMDVLISMLRGVNLGPHNRIKMDDLRALYESLKLQDAQTYVQSGNVVFRTKEKNAAKLAQRIQDAIGKKFGFRPEVIVRTIEELRQALDSNPFRKRHDIESSKLLITFLSAEPAVEAQTTIRNLKVQREELHLMGRELYIYFPDGIGKSKVPWSSVEKLLKVTGTARNLNSVIKMLEMAEQLDADASTR